MMFVFYMPACLALGCLHALPLDFSYRFGPSVYCTKGCLVLQSPPVPGFDQFMCHPPPASLLHLPLPRALRVSGSSQPQQFCCASRLALQFSRSSNPVLWPSLNKNNSSPSTT